MSEKPDKTPSLEEASPVATTAHPKIVADEKVITGNSAMVAATKVILLGLPSDGYLHGRIGPQRPVL
jgi:hypothetical protein